MLEVFNFLKKICSPVYFTRFKLFASIKSKHLWEQLVQYFLCLQMFAKKVQGQGFFHFFVSKKHFMCIQGLVGS